jgi:hypothetical protein
VPAVRLFTRIASLKSGRSLAGARNDAPDVPRVFPARYDQPSRVQPSGDVEGWRDNPLDDQNTVYGLTLAQRAHDEVFVTERERGLVRQLRIAPAADGRLTISRPTSKA